MPSSTWQDTDDRKPNVRLLPGDGALALEAPYHDQLLAGIKALPSSDRKWDGPNKRWLIAYKHAQIVVELVDQCFGERPAIPDLQPTVGIGTATLRMVRLEYVGRCRPRDDGEVTASGFADGSWSLVFPEAVLRAWFLDSPAEQAGQRRPDGQQTLYQVLMSKATASADDIKRAYRQLARQWHPDVCREPDASEMFLRIKHAYDLLSDDKKRRRYDAGLKLEASTQHERPKNFLINRHDDDALGYRAPLRCGLLLVEAISTLGQLTVHKILKWDDIVRDDGKVMISSWPTGAKTFEVRWA